MKTSAITLEYSNGITTIYDIKEIIYAPRLITFVNTNDTQFVFNIDNIISYKVKEQK